MEVEGKNNIFIITKGWMVKMIIYATLFDQSRKCVPLNKQMNKEFRTYTQTFVNCFLFAKCFLFCFLKLPLKCSKKKKNTNIDVKLLLNYI